MTDRIEYFGFETTTNGIVPLKEYLIPLCAEYVSEKSSNKPFFYCPADNEWLVEPELTKINFYNNVKGKPSLKH